MDSLITQIFSQQMQSQLSAWAYLLAFLGGVISSISPCTLGILPIVVGYVGGYSDNTSKKTVLQVLFFVVGLALTLTILGVTSAIAGKTFGSHAGPVWVIIMASLIMIMGLSLLEIIEIPMPAIIKQMPKNNNNSLILYPMILGGAFAFATTPCSTPILAGIMAYASMKANIVYGGLLLLFFSLGQGVILILAGLFTSLFKKLTFIRSISGYTMKFSGVILILTSIYIYLKVFEIV